MRSSTIGFTGASPLDQRPRGGRDATTGSGGTRQKKIFCVLMGARRRTTVDGSLVGIIAGQGRHVVARQVQVPHLLMARRR